MAIRFKPNDISLSMAIGIVETGLQDPVIHPATKIKAIQKVAGMATHNSITKSQLVAALQWIFERYDFEED